MNCLDYNVYGLMSESGSCESSSPRTTLEMKESPKTARWVPPGVVMGCKSMLKRLLKDGGWLLMDGGLLLTDGCWLLTEVGWLTDGGFPYAAERLLGGLALILERLDVHTW
jgi:hypothetical protein